MKINKRILRYSVIAALASLLLGVMGLFGAYLYLSPRLPNVDTLREVKFSIPLRIFTKDGKLISEFGEEKRNPVKYAEIPKHMINAIISAEDDNFFHHSGVDFPGLIRATLNMLVTGQAQQGGSTITMQVARNFFLTRDRTITRKLNEIFLAFKIERELKKEDILELYLNKIYLGNRAYGVAAAAQAYYGTSLEKLSLAQFAMIAGLPKAPSKYNPIANPERALLRRNYVLRRMKELDYIDEKSFKTAIADPDQATVYGQKNDIEALHAAEMAREYLIKKYGEEVYNLGHRVYTTIDSNLQAAAAQALRRAIMEYDLRHGYRGPITHVNINEKSSQENWDEAFDKADVSSVGVLRPALVVSIHANNSIKVYQANHGELIEIPWEGINWARRYINENAMGPAPQSAKDIAKVGDIIYIVKARDATTNKNFWRLSQLPDIEGALVAISPETGAIRALVGGFDFNLNKYNHVTQAKRQPGSVFKPFIYSSSLEKGFNPASIINDAPVVFDDPSLETTWRPENYSGQFFGPTRLRTALVNSRNLVSIRLLQAIGVNYSINFSANFGFDPKELPRNLSLALGSCVTTPLSIARGYATFANGGFLVEPYFIDRIEDASGKILEQAPTVVLVDSDHDTGDYTTQPVSSPIAVVKAKDKAEKVVMTPQTKRLTRTLSEQNAYMMTHMMRDVIREGTAKKALELGRNDLAGKTGTTNDQKDAWFSGFNSKLVATAWIGFDQPKPLGSTEVGGRAALPLWMYFMHEALKNIPENILKQPPGLVSIRIDPQTGIQAAPGDSNAIFELFYQDQVPQNQIGADTNSGTGGTTAPTGGTDSPEPIF